MSRSRQPVSAISEADPFFPAIIEVAIDLARIAHSPDFGQISGRIVKWRGARTRGQRPNLTKVSVAQTNVEWQPRAVREIRGLAVA